MARGDFVIFEEFVLNLGSENFIFPSGGDTIKLGLINNTAAPTAADATPTWSDYSANEVSTAGGYTAGGETLGSQQYTEAGGTATFDAADVSLTQNGSGFTDAYWGILYDSTNATGMAIGYLDLGGPVSEQAGDVTITWNGSGIFTVAKA